MRRRRGVLMDVLLILIGIYLIAWYGNKKDWW